MADTLKWEATINGKRYGSGIGMSSKFNNDDIREAVSILCKQMTLSLQKIINGKNDLDKMAEDAKKRFDVPPLNA